MKKIINLRRSLGERGAASTEASGVFFMLSVFGIFFFVEVGQVTGNSFQTVANHGGGTDIITHSSEIEGEDTSSSTPSANTNHKCDDTVRGPGGRANSGRGGKCFLWGIP